MSSDELVVGRDEREVVEQPGQAEISYSGAPAAGVVVPLEPEHLPRHNLRHDR